jgi:hypothetical protein
MRMFFLTKAEKYFLVEASLGQICGNEESLQAFNNGCSSKLSLRLILKSTTIVVAQVKLQGDQVFIGLFHYRIKYVRLLFL